MQVDTLIAASRPFIEWVVNWLDNLERIPLESVIVEPERTAILAIDLLRGFCSQGPLASERAASTIQPVVKLFQAAHARGVRHFILPQEHHPADAIEFESYGPHCIAGTPEAETVPELTGLPFSDRFVVVEKNSINPFIETQLESWLREHPEVNTFIVVGVCTDICAYQLAMHLRLRANALQMSEVRVVLPVDCSQTYDLPVPVAQQIGAVPHDGDLLHLIFLYHIMLNGVEVVEGLGMGDE